MIRTPQEFVNEVRARFSERMNDEIEEHGKTVMHFAEENNRLRAERDRLRDLVKRLVTIRETLVWRKDEKTGLMYYDRVPDEEWACKTIEEAKAIIKEDEK